MANWTIANLSDLSAPFVDVFAEPFSNQVSVASSVDPSSWWVGCSLEYLEAILPNYANGSLRGVDIHDPLGLLEGAKVVSVESVYHAMELGRANV